MFDVAPAELLVVAAVAVAVIPSKDLPKAMRFAGQWIGKARGMARHFRSGVDEMIRQAELDEMEKKWREENERIMREHPFHEAIEHADTGPSALPAPGMEPVTGEVTTVADVSPTGNGAEMDPRESELPLDLPPRDKSAA